MKISCNTTEQRPNRPAAGWAGIEQIGQQFRRSQTKMDSPNKKIQLKDTPNFHVMEMLYFPNWMKFIISANKFNCCNKSLLNFEPIGENQISALAAEMLVRGNVSRITSNIRYGCQGSNRDLCFNNSRHTLLPKSSA